MENNISEARRSYALEHGKFTQEDAAKFFGVSVGTYAHWEQGTGKLNGDILKRISLKYGCSVDYLLCRTENSTPYTPCSKGPFDDMRLNEIVMLYNSVNEETKQKMHDVIELMADGVKARIEKEGPERVADKAARSA